MSLLNHFNDGLFPSLRKETTVKRATSKENHVSVWKVWVEGDKVFTTWHYEGGKERKPTSKQCRAKNVGKSNEITAHQCALNTAKTTWVKKVVDGFQDDGEYSALMDEIRSAYERQGGSINNIAYTVNTIKALSNTQYTSSETKRVYPMLAIDKSKLDSIPTPCFVQPKYDGVRSIAIITEDGVLLQSRTGKQHQGLPIVRKALHELFPTGVVLDGELFSVNGHLDTTSIIRRQGKHPGNDERIRYHVFDIITDQEMTQKDRFELLDGLFKKDLQTEQQQSENVISVPRWLCESEQDVIKTSKELIEKGYEGSIIRPVEGIYLQNGRSARRSTKTRPFLVKFKLFQDAEFEIIGYSRVTGGDQDGAIVLRCKTRDGKEFKAKRDGNVTENRELYQRGNTLIGKLATVAYQELSPYGIPRFPIVKSIRDYE